MNVYMLRVERAPDMDMSGNRYEKLDPRYQIEYQGPKVPVTVYSIFTVPFSALSHCREYVGKISPQSIASLPFSIFTLTKLKIVMNFANPH